MNRRILELADQAEDYADGVVDQGGEFHPAYTQKLAELMIIEFSDVVKQTANEIITAGFKGDGTSDEVMLCVNGALNVLDNIRKRFGG